MNDLKQCAETIASFMRLITSTGHLQLKYRITAGPGAADPDGFERRDIYVECRGPDVDLLLQREGELLLALEDIAAAILRHEGAEYGRVSFDAGGFKAGRIQAVRELASAAVEFVTSSGKFHCFQPMDPRERRLLHLFLRQSGLRSASSGEDPHRYVVLYSHDDVIPPAAVSSPLDPGALNLDRE
jgi:spoIIIJ-associated protein